MDREEIEAREKIREIADKTSTCASCHKFNIGDHGTVYAGCGIEAGQDHKYHQAMQGTDEELVIFRWLA